MQLGSCGLNPAAEVFKRFLNQFLIFKNEDVSHENLDFIKFEELVTLAQHLAWQQAAGGNRRGPLNGAGASSVLRFLLLSALPPRA